MNQNYTSGKIKIASYMVIFSFLGFPLASFSQLVVTPGGTPASIITSLAGAGLTITNPVVNCGSDNVAAAYGTFNGSASNIGLQNGVILTTGNATNAQGPNVMSGITGIFSPPNDFSDPQLITIDPAAVNDVCILEFDVIPHCSFMEFRFVFGSDEYPEFVNSAYNDAFGFFVTGPDASCNPLGYNNTNVAILPSGTPVSINNINNGNTSCPSPMPGPCVNCAYYVDNCSGATVEYDGFTTPIVVDLNVCPCATYHWKFAIADVGDHALDSGVFIDYLTCASPFAYNLVTSQAACGGICDGTAAVNISSGTPPYSFLWSTGATTQSITGLCPGNYSVDVIDAISCGTPLTQNVTITGSSAMNTFYVQNNVTCNGGNNGSIVIDSVTGGITPLHYLWSTSPNDTLTTLNGLLAGPYTVTITDAFNCTSSQTVIVNEPTALGPSLITSANATCIGANNGTASIGVIGGTAPYTYFWSNGAGTNASATGLLPIVYIVTMTDFNGCTATQAVPIVEPPALNLSIVSFTDITCNGASNGTGTVGVTGGTGPYTYSWSNGAGTNASATGLQPIVYNVTITDFNGCTSTQAVPIIEPPALNPLIVSITYVTCNGASNGIATVGVTGGTGPFTYSWSNGAGTNATATGLNSLVYIVTMTDFNGCTTTQNVPVTEPSILVPLLVTSTNVTCNGVNDGTGTISASGGTGPYTYSWSNGAGTNVTATGLQPIVYVATITDFNGCTATQNIPITEPPLLSPSLATSTNATCNGANNGTGTVTVSGGTVPYTYSWSNGGGTDSSATGLQPIAYMVTITDANGCITTQNVPITEPAIVVLDAQGSTTICIGQNAIISASGSGGTPPFSYLWNNTVTDSAQTVTPISSATYSVVVTDANGCSPSAQSVLINVNPPLNVNASATPSICFGSTATISASVGGGNGGPYSYSWNNGSITSANASVAPDHDSTFTVVLTDGCSPPVQSSVNIIVNALPVAAFVPLSAQGCPPLSVSFTSNSVAAPGSSYHWNFGDGLSSSSQNPSHVYSDPGVYDVLLIVNTPEGCSDSLNVANVVTVLGVPTAMFAMSEPEISMYNPIISFTDLSTGAMWWNWNFGDGTGTSDSANPAYRYNEAGIYTIQLIVENSVGCFDTTYSILRVANEITLYVPTGFTPNGDNVNDYFMAYGIGISEFDMWVYDRWGTQVFHTSDREHPWNGAQDGNGKACQSDVYVYKIQYKDIEGKSHDYVGHVTLVR